VPIEAIVDALWPTSAPDSAINLVQGYVSKTRKALGSIEGGADRLLTKPSGYMLDVAPEEFDVLKFERLANEGRTLSPHEPDRAAQRLRAALLLWRGPAFVDFVGEDFAQPMIGRLEETRLGVLEDLMEIELTIGDRQSATEELLGLAKAYPLRERFHAQLMRALHASGRQAEALRVYSDARRTLVDELGLEPGAELQAAQSEVLAGVPVFDDSNGMLQRLGTPSTMPRVEYARSGDAHIAYQVLGEGSIDVIWIPGWVSHLEVFWEEPRAAEFALRLASRCRLIMFDKRGTGLSDRPSDGSELSLEQRVEDVLAVMKAAGSRRAVFLGVSEGGSLAILMAAMHPLSTAGLILYSSYARLLWARDYPEGMPERQLEDTVEEVETVWGRPGGLERFAVSRSSDEAIQRWWARVQRLGASPGGAIDLLRMIAAIDVRHMLTSISCPTVILHRREDAVISVEAARFLARSIAGARYREMEGNDHLVFVGDTAAILGEIDSLLDDVDLHGDN